MGKRAAVATGVLAMALPALKHAVKDPRIRVRAAARAAVSKVGRKG